jgi:hypothetical protein
MTGRAAPRTGHRTDAAVPDGRLAALVLLIGVGAVMVPVLGPLVLGVLELHVSAGAADQVRGGDVATLLLVAPAALVAAYRLHRGLPGGAALALAPAGFGLYLWTELALGGDPGRYPGNSERFFVLLWVLTAAAAAVLVIAAARVAAQPPPEPRRRLERLAGWYLLVSGVFLAVGVHLPSLVDASRAEPRGAEYLADPVVFWVVKLMDLAFVLPLLVAVGVGALRGGAGARRALAPVLGWAALLATSVAGMAVVMLVRDAPGASAGLAVGFVLVAAGALALAGAAYRPLLVPTSSIRVTRTGAAAG